jgi:hypothetical protein
MNQGFAVPSAVPDPNLVARQVLRDVAAKISTPTLQRWTRSDYLTLKASRGAHSGVPQTHRSGGLSVVSCGQHLVKCSRIDVPE